MMPMFLKSAVLVAFGLTGVLAGPYQAEEGVRTLNFTRPVEVCSDSYPQRIYYSGEQSYNFTEFYFANRFHKSAAYGLSYTWAKDYMFGDSLSSRKGNRDINALNWRCLRRCLVMNHCSSFALVKDFSEKRRDGYHRCQFFSKPIRRQNMELQDSTSESRAMRVYNLVCPEKVQDYFQNKLNTVGGIGVKGGPFGNEWQDWETEYDRPFLPHGASIRGDEEKVSEWREMQRDKEDRLEEEKLDDDETELDGEDEDDSEDGYEDGNEGDAPQPTLHDHEGDKVDKPRPKGRVKDSVGRNKSNGSGKSAAEIWSKEPKQSKGGPGEMFPHEHKDGVPSRDPDDHAREFWLDDKQKRSEIGTDDSYFVVKAATDRNKAYKAEVDVIPDNPADRFVDRQGFRGLESQTSGSMRETMLRS